MAQTKQVNIHLKNASLNELLTNIESQTNYRFAYRNELVDKIKNISYEKDNVSVKEVLTEILSTTPLSYKMVSETSIIISSKEKEQSDSSEAAVDEYQLVRGVVKDSKGDPIIGAYIYVKGDASNGTSSNLEGGYSLTVPNNAVLEFSYIGFHSQEITIAGRRVIDVVLLEDTRLLDEVVVVGYGVQKKQNLTGSVSQIKMEDVLKDRPVTSIGSALQGAIPGLVISTSAQPGVAPSFNIRGTTSINGGSPLILVDNVPASAEMVNPEDIESVSVLKDASSSAIYGARAAFGVVLITTKKGAKNTKFSLSYNDNIGFENAVNLPQQVSVRDWMDYWQEAFGDTYYIKAMDMNSWKGLWDQYHSNPSSFTGVEDSGRYVDPNGNTYFLKEHEVMLSSLDDYGFQQTHNVSASGGTDKITYRIGMGYTDNNGIMKGNKDTYERVNMSSYVSADITDWLTTSLDVKYAKTARFYPNASFIFTNAYVNFWPTGTVTDTNGKLQYWQNPENDLMLSSVNTTKQQNPRIYSRTSIRPFTGMEVIMEYTYNGTVYDYTNYSGYYTLMHPQNNYPSNPTTSSFTNTKSQTDYNAYNVYGAYSKSFNEAHNLKIMAGFSQETSWYKYLNVNRLDMINPDMPSISGAVGETTATDSYSDYVIRGGYGRVNYDYKGRYLLEFSGRYDGSSKFPTYNRFGFFPSASAGWQVAKEPFMEWSKKWLNELKIRGSFGQLGNQAINNYAYIAAMSSFKASWIIDSAQPITLSTPAMVSSNFTWEVVQTLDVGLDLSLFNDRLQASWTRYQRDTKGMLTAGMEFPAEVGADAPLQNVANLRTQGWELGIQWRNTHGQFHYSVGANIYDSKTKITKFGNANQLLSNYYVGQTLGNIWGYETDGFYTIDDFVSSTEGIIGWQNGVWTLKEGVTSIQGVTVKPGDVKFVNLRDDAVSVNRIDAGESTLNNSGDRKVIGNDAARYQYGLNASIGWKGFEVYVFFQGTGKRDYWHSGALRWPFGTGSTDGAVFEGQENYWSPSDINANTVEGWTPVNPNAYHARIYDNLGNRGSNNRVQTKYLMNAAYLRCKNLTVSYSLPKTVLSKVHLKNLKVFFSGENLFTLDYLPTGYDPERLSWGYPYYRTLSLGLNITL